LPNYIHYAQKRAPLVRNDEIVVERDRLAVFWDGFSEGTAYTVNMAKKARKPVDVRLPG
jgi:hypothetical protein